MDYAIDLESVGTEPAPVLPRVASRDAAINDAVRGDGEVLVRARRLNDVELPTTLVETCNVVIVHEVGALGIQEFRIGKRGPAP